MVLIIGYWDHKQFPETTNFILTDFDDVFSQEMNSVGMDLESYKNDHHHNNKIDFVKVAMMD